MSKACAVNKMPVETQEEEIWVNRGGWQVAVRTRSVEEELVNRLMQKKGLSEVVATVVAGRNVTPEYLWPTLSELDPPDLLPDIGKAATIIAQAIVEERPIVSATDSDSDGNSAQAIVYESLTKYFDVPAGNVLAIAGHKLKSGYGLTDSLVDKILAWRENEIKLVITSDMGSSDEARIQRLKALGHSVVVTDHHEFPMEDGSPVVPKSAEAVVSPARPESAYPDRKIAGCYVAFLVMTQVRQKLIELGYLSEKTPKLTPLISMAALGTVVDCVSMAASRNNRALVLAGLRQIQKGDRPCWRVANRKVRGIQVTSEDLMFLLGPSVNAFSRVGEPLGGSQFFLAQDESIAEFWWTALETANERRKKIEREMTEKAVEQAQQQEEEGRKGLVIFLEDGHPGIHGINASRITERFGRPCGVFSPQYGSETMLTGSFRTVDGFHVKQGFDAISQAAPEVFPPGTFGGHAGAGGARLDRANLEAFRELFDREVRRQTKGAILYPYIEVDGHLNPAKIDDRLLHELHSLEPYGREFPEARFISTFQVKKKRRIGKTEEHLSLELESGGKQFRAVWFFVETTTELELGKHYQVVYAPKWNYWRNTRKIQLMVFGVRAR